MSELLTVDELAQWLKISPRSVRELCRTRVRDNQKNKIPMLKINRAVRFNREAVEQWLKELQEVSRAKS